MYIGKPPTVGNFQVCDAISVVNGQAAYTLQVGGTNVAPESANHMLVSLNGILQKPGSSFTISGSTMTFASNLATGDVIDFVQILGNVLDIGQPSDDTVKTASIQANAITGAKLNTDVISAQTALGATPADTDEFLVSDAGVLKRVDYSYIKSEVTPIAAEMDRGDNTQQTISNNTGTQVVFSRERFDLGSCADPSNNKFVIPSGEGGKYFFYFRIGYSNPSTSGHRILYLRRANSGGSFSAIKEFQDNGGLFAGNAATGWVGAATMDMDAGQEADLQIYQGSGGDLSLNPVSGQNLFFGMFKIAGTT